MSSGQFLIDSNSLITPHKQYYPFDLIPVFWERIKCYMEDGSILCLDLVIEEILKVEDELKIWFEGIQMQAIEHREVEIIDKYREVLQYIQSCDYYKESALRDWAESGVADPWLIAVASVFDFTIVTFEKPNGNLNMHNPSKKAKIPDVAQHFGVKVVDLFAMMRELKFKL